MAIISEHQVVRGGVEDGRVAGGGERERGGAVRVVVPAGGPVAVVVGRRGSTDPAAWSLPEL